MRQFILENQNIKNGIAELSGKDFRYLRQVLRVKTGDMLNVRFPDGKLQATTVVSVDDKLKKIKIQVCDILENQKENSTITRGVQADEIDEVLNLREYWLFQFIPKPQKFEQIVRQATECGICKIIPVIGEYSEKNSVLALQNSKKERIEKIIREARQQSGSPVPTEVLSPLTLDEALSLWGKQTARQKVPYSGLVLSERTEKCIAFADFVQRVKNNDSKKIAVAVGSEGGISPSEIEKLCQKELFQPVHFVVNILRCETAALYGIAAIQTALE